MKDGTASVASARFLDLLACRLPLAAASKGTAFPLGGAVPTRLCALTPGAVLDPLSSFCGKQSLAAEVHFCEMDHPSSPAPTAPPKKGCRDSYCHTTDSQPGSTVAGLETKRGFCVCQSCLMPNQRLHIQSDLDMKTPGLHHGAEISSQPSPPQHSRFQGLAPARTVSAPPAASLQQACWQGQTAGSKRRH